MAVKPITIPNAAGIDYADGDVRHFAPNDSFSVPAIATPTRQLAHRDNLIADKLNEVVEVVNNKEQYINLPTMRTALPPAASEVVTNFRVPPGFEARVLNCIVTSIPSGNGRLDIEHNSFSFGGTAGTNIVSTKNEFPGTSEVPGGVEFKPTGEFVIKLTNDGGTSAEIVASVILTMRPVSESTDSVLGPGVEGLPGKDGKDGIDGKDGKDGINGEPGEPGLVWQGAWAAGTFYQKDEAVRYNGSSYISLRDNNAGHTPPEETDDWWDLVAKGGNDGETTQDFDYQGNWESGTTYAEGDVVRVINNGVSRTFVANASERGENAEDIPPSTGWDELFGPSVLPFLSRTTVDSRILFGVGYEPGEADEDNPDYKIFNPDSGSYSAWSNATTYAAGAVVKHESQAWFSKQAGNLNHEPPTGDEEDDWWYLGLPFGGFQQVEIYGTTAGATTGLAFLSLSEKLIFSGKAIIELPDVSSTGAEWTNTNCFCTVVPNEIPASPTEITVNKVEDSDRRFEVTITGTAELKVDINIKGTAEIVTS